MPLSRVRVASLLTFVATAACSRPPLGEGLPADAAKALQPCLAQTEDVRDHCAVTVAGQLDLTGADWMLLCGQLGGGTAHDLCIERAAWAERAPAPHDVCARIKEERTRQSCLLGATNALIDGPIAALVDVCARTDALEADCWVHVTTERRHYWLEAGEEQLVADVQEAVKLRPSLASCVPFASEVGRALLRLPVAPNPRVCESFEMQVPQMTCRNQLRDGQR